MKKIDLFILAGAAMFMFFFTSCEGCVRKVAKKATDISISAVEGVSESLSERGEETSEKMTDALGAVLKGAGKSIDKQLDKHAEYVASIAGRTLVQTIDSLESGLLDEHYDPISYESDFVEGIVLQRFGKIKDSDVLDAYFVIVERGAYTCSFDFVDEQGNVLLSRKANIEEANTEKKFSVVSLALNSDESNLVAQSLKTKIKVEHIKE